MAIEGKPGPTQVFQVFAHHRLLKQVSNCRGDAGVMVMGLEGQERQRRGSRDGFETAPQDRAVAIVDPALVKSPVQEQAQTLDNAWVITMAGVSQCKASPGRGFDPREIA